MASTEELAIACIVLFFACALSSAGGVGGGGLNVPVFLLICGYSFKTAATYSLFVVLGNSVAQTSLNYNKPHPVHKRFPMVYWEFICLLLPAQLGGGNIGAYLNKMLSDEALYVVALVVLTFAATISLRKGVIKWQAETAAKLKESSGDQSVVQNPVRSANVARVPAGNRERSESFHFESGETGHHPALSDSSFTPAPSMSSPAGHERKGSTSLRITTNTSVSSGGIVSLNTKKNATTSVIQWPWEFITVISVTWFIQLGIRIGLRVVTLCGIAFIILFVILYIPLSWCSLWSIYYLNYGSKNTGLANQGNLSDEPHKSSSTGNGERASDANIMDILALRASGTATASGIDGTADHDGSWKMVLQPVDASMQRALEAAGIRQSICLSDPINATNVNEVDLRANSVMLVVYIFTIGILAQLLGIGGAELISPLMLVLHMSPEVASATSGVMNTMNTLANVLISLAHNTSSMDLKAILCLTGFLGGFTGRYCGLYVASKLGRPSVIIFALVSGLYLTCLFYVYSLAAGGLDSSADGFCS